MTDDDVRDLLRLVEAAQTDWVNGRFHPLFGLDEGTIFGPFGGPATGGPGLGAGQAAMASMFRDGTTELEVVNTIVSGDIVCLILVERNQVRFAGHADARPWILRTTMVFRRDAGTWTLLHRHADPLIERRDLAATLELLPETLE